MKSKMFAVAGLGLVLATGSALTQTKEATASTSPLPTLSLRQHGPMRLHAVVPGGVTSENWSGYAVTGKNFTYAKGAWHVPQPNCGKTPDSYSSFWVGLDGYSDNTVEQIGTETDCDGTSPTYYAWYEFYPLPMVQIDMSISPGDVMGASVTYGDGIFTLGLHNHTTGAEFHTTLPLAGPHRSSAEWIAEAPSNSGGVLPLADFVRANYGEDYNSDPGTNYASDSTVNDGPIIDFGGDVVKITMEQFGVTLAAPTALTADGTSFRVNWKAE
jgi:Peptidase A4 family